MYDDNSNNYENLTYLFGLLDEEEQRCFYKLLEQCAELHKELKECENKKAPNHHRGGKG